MRDFRSSSPGGEQVAEEEGMTVRELITDLQNRDPEAIVYYPHGEREAREVLDVGPVKEWKDIGNRKYTALVLNEEYSKLSRKM